MTDAEVELALRTGIIKRIVSLYPSTSTDFSSYLVLGKKVSIYSWIGDAFTTVLRAQGLSQDYDKWRQKLFIDYQSINRRYTEEKEMNLQPGDAVELISGSKPLIVVAVGQTECLVKPANDKNATSTLVRIAELKLLSAEVKLEKPTNALKLPISELIERLQKLPPGTTYKEVGSEFYGGGSRETGLGTGYQMRIEIVEGFES